MKKICLQILGQLFFYIILTTNCTLLAYDKYSEPYYDKVNKIFSNFEGEKKKILEQQDDDTYKINDFYDKFYPIPHIAWKSFYIFLDSSINAPQDYYSFDNQIKEWQINEKPKNKSFDPIITWIGHSTFLIQIADLNILTDAVFGDLSVLYRRNAPPGISFENLPKIDVVLISHCHRDHLDKDSLNLVIKRDNPLVFLPKKTIRKFNCCLSADLLVKQCLPDFNKNKIRQFNWWDILSFKNGMIAITFTPACHGSGFVWLDANKSLWGGWMITYKNFEKKSEYKEYNIYFAGDTAYDEDLFKIIAKKFPSIDVALLPIGPDEPRDLVKDCHLSSDESVKAFFLLKAKKFIGMHFNTFKLGTDKFSSSSDNVEKLFKQMDKSSSLIIPKFGKRIELNL